jgi:hypothetical protein
MSIYMRIVGNKSLLVALIRQVAETDWIYAKTEWQMTQYEILFQYSRHLAPGGHFRYGTNCFSAL